MMEILIILILLSFLVFKIFSFSKTSVLQEKRKRKKNNSLIEISLLMRKHSYILEAVFLSFKN